MPIIRAKRTVAWENLRNEDETVIDGRTYKGQAPWGSGVFLQQNAAKTLFRANVFKGSYWFGDPPRRVNRAEWSGHPDMFGQLDEILLSYAMKVDAKSGPITFAYLGQLHDQPGVGDAPADPPYEHDVIGTTFRIRKRSSNVIPLPSNPAGVILYTKTITYGRWYYFVVRLVPGPSGDGVIQVWLDGTQVVDHTGAFGFASSIAGSYWKFGIYDDEGFVARSVWYANMEVRGVADSALIMSRILNPLPLPTGAG